jgi:hypothetical protein
MCSDLVKDCLCWALIQYHCLLCYIFFEISFRTFYDKEVRDLEQREQSISQNVKTATYA